jgi:hypothetical protein
MFHSNAIPDHIFAFAGSWQHSDVPLEISSRASVMMQVTSSCSMVIIENPNPSHESATIPSASCCTGQWNRILITAVSCQTNLGRKNTHGSGRENTGDS